ncbi:MULTISPECIES: cell envelope integrity protein TolA [Kosakonia]|uniref:cell envelope integrity protein TolA n=1 Tax=Kosakonia TaxID=1330547 RepID=UPI00201DD23F|nr:MULTISPECIES: cell envelope integrity protein TolA [Kosakonia]MCL6746066.1 cell envelope integrity protein TolA [Kosakonia sp. R1.Fl]MDZ7321294.1 cell envelope integrity protein TolA [Kosakonia sacchari]
MMKINAGHALLLMTSLLLLGCTQTGSARQRAEANAEVDNMFAGYKRTQTTAAESDINRYAGQIKLAIESHLFEAGRYAGKSCTLQIRLAENGALDDAQPTGGDPALCRAGIIAIRQARLPKPPSPAAYAAFKNATLEFKL